MKQALGRERLRVVVLMTRLPYPPDTGAKTRTYNLLRVLGKRHDIWLVGLALEQGAEEAVTALREHCCEVIAVPAQLPRGRAAETLAQVANFFGRLPMTVAKYWSPVLIGQVEELASRVRPDVIHCDSLQASANVPRGLRVPVVLTEHNVEWIIWQRYAERVRNPAVRLALAYQARKMQQYEIAICGQLAHVVAVSDNDRAILKKLPGVSGVEVVPNGVDCDYFRPNGTVPRAGRLIFTGSMDWIPNADAACFFVQEILPYIAREVPHAHFWIVGRSPRPQVVALAGRDNRVTVTGPVPDIRRQMDEAAVAVAPLRIGSGTRLKILEAMAMGKAIVSTSVGCEGLAVRHGEHLLVADEPEAFARETVRLLGDEGLRVQLGKAARRLAQKEYDWPLVAQRLEVAWRRAAASRWATGGERAS